MSLCRPRWSSRRRPQWRPWAPGQLTFNSRRSHHVQFSQCRWYSQWWGCKGMRSYRGEWSWFKVPRRQKPVTFTFLECIYAHVYFNCSYINVAHVPLFSNFCLKDIKLLLGELSHSATKWLSDAPSSGDVQMMQIPQGLMPNRARVVQKPVVVQRPLNSVDTSSRLQIKPLPQTLPTPVTTTFHSLTAGQSIPSLRTERSEELPGTVKLNQGVESLEPSGLASASKSFFR